MNTIEVKNIIKSFDGKLALDNISFSIESGEIFGFLGPSGAGKTTTINILTGQALADGGFAKVMGKESQSLTDKDMSQFGLMSDTLGFYEKMSLYKNLEFFARFHQIPLERLDNLLKYLDLWEDRQKKAEKLSTGMKQRMLLIRAVLHEPNVLFLDEPTSGLDPVMTQKVHTLLREIVTQGTSIFLTTHDMQEATKLCDRVALLHKGKIQEQGSPRALIDKYRKDDKVRVRLHSGEELVIPQADLSQYWSKGIASVHSQEPSLESIFIELTGEKFNG